MVRAARRGKGSGPEVPMSGKEHSSEEGHPENLFLYGLDAGVVIHAEGHHPSRHGFVRGHR